MLEKLAEKLYRYYQEAKAYIIFTLVVFGIAMLHNHYGTWVDGHGLSNIVLFLQVFGDVILLGFCLCVLFLCFIYAFHPELNGKHQHNNKKLMLAYFLSAMFSISAGVLLLKVILNF
ncbi:hypothetical protein [Agarilytica rhodophyticola]|uniref:hypothetical protein n=1 Tax=Agarilytica rhodophyticola TaxID=1737490 RepID=UPI000B3449CC|nr:hypothetical protein [Agarilytica rhodophyticola]